MNLNVNQIDLDRDTGSDKALSPEAWYMHSISNTPSTSTELAPIDLWSDPDRLHTYTRRANRSGDRLVATLFEAARQSAVAHQNIADREGEWSMADPAFAWRAVGVHSEPVAPEQRRQRRPRLVLMGFVAAMLGVIGWGAIDMESRPGPKVNMVAAQHAPSAGFLPGTPVVDTISRRLKNGPAATAIQPAPTVAEGLTSDLFAMEPELLDLGYDPMVSMMNPTENAAGPAAETPTTEVQASAFDVQAPITAEMAIEKARSELTVDVLSEPAGERMNQGPVIELAPNVMTPTADTASATVEHAEPATMIVSYPAQ